MKIDLAPLWRTLEIHFAPCTNLAQWRAWLGDAFELIAPLLTFDPVSASELPCDWRPRVCARRVNTSHGEHRAVCENRAPECPDLVLQPTDLSVYALPPERLAAVLGTALQLQRPCGSQVEELQAWIMGFVPVGGLPAFLYLTLPGDGTSPSYSEVIDSLLTRTQGGPIGIVTPGAHPRDEFSRAVRARNGHLFTCGDLFEADARREFIARRLPFRRAPSHPDRRSAADVQPLALHFSHEGTEGIAVLSDEQLAELRAKGESCDHFVDGLQDRPTCSRRSEEGREFSELTRGEILVLAAFLARRAARLEHARPEHVQIPDLAPDSRKQAFKRLRRKIDRQTEVPNRYSLFKAERALGGVQLYMLRPDRDATFCFLIRPAEYELVRPYAESADSE